MAANLRLLLATEHSEFDAGAERVAFALAKREIKPLPVVLPVVSNPEFEAVAPELAAKADAQAARRGQALVAAAGVPLAIEVRRGQEPYLEIIDEARRQGAELLIIRRRGKRGFLANLLVGEMVSKIVAHAPCSVLIVPRAARLWSHGVLVGLDPRVEHAAVLEHAIDFAAKSALPLFVVSVAETAGVRDTAERTVGAACTRARAAGVEAQGEVANGRVHEALVAALAARGADLLVLGRHSGGLARAWVGGSAQKLIGLVDCPVLIGVA